jgi:hypothetical protein
MGAYLRAGDKVGGGFDVVMTGGAQPQRLKGCATQKLPFGDFFFLWH